MLSNLSTALTTLFGGEEEGTDWTNSSISSHFVSHGAVPVSAGDILGALLMPLPTALLSSSRTRSWAFSSARTFHWNNGFPATFKSFCQGSNTALSRTTHRVEKNLLLSDSLVASTSYLLAWPAAAFFLLFIPTLLRMFLGSFLWPCWPFLSPFTACLPLLCLIWDSGLCLTPVEQI